MGIDRLRWFAMSVLVLSSALNYLDRAVLNSLMPTLKEEFNLRGEDLGLIITAFSIPYALASPLMGLFIDRVGLRFGAATMVGLWSMAGMATGLAGSLGALMSCRSVLGLAEAGGIPATAKGSAVYLQPRDRALGSAISQVGLTIGAVAAPVLTELLSARYGWRSAFVVTGALGFVWIPLWLWTSRRVPAAAVRTDPKKTPYSTMLRDRRFLTLIGANVLAMTIYSLWTNWAPLFLVSAYGLSQAEANLRFVWIPPLFATLGGLLGGWLAQRSIRHDTDVLPARLRIAFGASLVALTTAAAPLAGSPQMATAAICLSLSATTCLSVNYYAIPLDLFGADRAAFGVSFLTSVYGVMQALLSPTIGRWSETAGWAPVCSLVAILPLVSVLLLRTAFPSKT